MTTNVFEAAAQRLCHNGGFTLSPRTGKFHDEPKGFAVAIAGYEQVEPLGHNFDLAIEVFLSQNWPNAKRTGNNPLFVGGWFNPENSKVYLDASIIVDNLGDALALAKSSGQLSVYDFANATAVFTEDYK